MNFRALIGAVILVVCAALYQNCAGHFSAGSVLLPSSPQDLELASSTAVSPVSPTGAGPTATPNSILPTPTPSVPPVSSSPSTSNPSASTTTSCPLDGRRDSFGFKMGLLETILTGDVSVCQKFCEWTKASACVFQRLPGIGGTCSAWSSSFVGNVNGDPSSSGATFSVRCTGAVASEAFGARTRASLRFIWPLIFDPEYYLEHNPDLKLQLGTDLRAAALHWEKQGYLEGRQGHPKFWSKAYLKNRPQALQMPGSEPDLVKAFQDFESSGFEMGVSGI